MKLKKYAIIFTSIFVAAGAMSIAPACRLGKRVQTAFFPIYNGKTDIDPAFYERGTHDTAAFTPFQQIANAIQSFIPVRRGHI